MVKAASNSSRHEAMVVDPSPSSVCRKLLQIRPNIKQQNKTKRSSLTRALIDYLTSDSFMYGPLLTPPLKKSHETMLKESESIPKAGDSEGVAHLTPLPQDKVVNTNSPATPSSEVHTRSTITRRIAYHTSENGNSNEDQVIPEEFEFCRKLVEERILRPPLEDDGKAIDRDGNANVSDQAEEDEDDDESSRSFTELHGESDVTTLSKEAAVEVARRLVKKLGGRFSKELGIFVDVRDSEVERWFLATTFLSHPFDFEFVKQMFKKLQSVGISKMQDVLGIDQNELKEAFKSTMHSARMATRLQKIALGMHTKYGGGISALKHVQEYGELKRELESLPGYSRNTARLFLREMRGIWRGATPEFEIPTRNAAKHLHLVPSIKDGTESTASLVTLAQDAGLDERDLEVALVKLAYQHARHYRNCLGGRDCEFARITYSDLDHLIVNL